MKPRPPVWFAWYCCPNTYTSVTPPSPARPPDTSTATYFIVYTFTPSVSAASGSSPTDRRRSPNGVRHSSQ